MGLLDLFKKRESLPDIPDNNIVAVCDGQMVEAKDINDPMFAKEMLGQTIAFHPTSHDIVAPCNGTLEVLFPTGHAFAIRMKDGTGVLVHVGINTVDLGGEGFKVFAKQGTQVKAGQKIINIDLDFVQKSGYDTTTMLIITEPVNDKKYVFKDYGPKEKTEIIL